MAYKFLSKNNNAPAVVSQTRTESQQGADSQKLSEYKKRREDANAALQKKGAEQGAIVFLTDNVITEGSDLVIQGHFFNGAKVTVGKIQKIRVGTVTLRQFDQTVKEIQDISCPDVDFSSLPLGPGTSSGTVLLRLTGAAPKEAFNDFDVVGVVGSGRKVE